MLAVPNGEALLYTLGTRQSLVCLPPNPFTFLNTASSADKHKEQKDRLDNYRTDVESYNTM